MALVAPSCTEPDSEPVDSSANPAGDVSLTSLTAAEMKVRSTESRKKLLDAAAERIMQKVVQTAENGLSSLIIKGENLAGSKEKSVLRGGFFRKVVGGTRHVDLDVVRNELLPRIEQLGYNVYVDTDEQRDGIKRRINRFIYHNYTTVVTGLRISW
jgi:hypothetical protein